MAERDARSPVRFLSDQAEIAAQDEAERGRKLFVGNIRFEDLQRRFPTVFAFKKHAHQRVQSLLSIFSAFGVVCSVRGSWHRDGLPMNGARAWCFVVYESAESAALALSALRVHEERVARCHQLAKQRRVTFLCVHDCPRADFYVRRPRNYVRLCGEVGAEEHPRKKDTPGFSASAEHQQRGPDSNRLPHHRLSDASQRDAASMHAVQLPPPYLLGCSGVGGAGSEASRPTLAQWAKATRTVKPFHLDPLRPFAAELPAGVLANLCTRTSPTDSTPVGQAADGAAGDVARRASRTSQRVRARRRQCQAQRLMEPGA
jgi:hypothetical protein